LYGAPGCDSRGIALSTNSGYCCREILILTDCAVDKSAKPTKIKSMNGIAKFAI
jgi:hypothetical protein